MVPIFKAGYTFLRWLQADIVDFRGVAPGRSMGFGPTLKLGFSDSTRSVLQKPEDNSLLHSFFPFYKAGYTFFEVVTS